LKSLGKTIILSSHIFATLKECCDQLFLLENGQITKKVEKKNFQELEDEMKEKKYS